MTEEKTGRYGIIGVGMMGREHLINLYHLRHLRVSVVAIADPHLPSQRAAVELANSFNWPLQVFSRHTELLDSGLCDVLIVSSPNMTHFEILMDIIAHPKPHHVLVEKPLCTTVSHCKQVVDAAKKREDMMVQVGLEYRYMPPVAKLIQLVRGGDLGPVRMVSIREHRFPFLVKVNNWNRFNINSGGTLVEKCCHFFDLMRLFAGANPVRVMASGAMDVNHKDEVYDGKGEAFVPEGIVRFGTRVAGRDGVQTIKTVDDRINLTHVLTAQRGFLWMTHNETWVGIPSPFRYDGLHHGSSYLEHLNFLHAIRARGAQAPEVDLTDGLISVAIGVAAQVSIEQGRFVTIQEVLT